VGPIEWGPFGTHEQTMWGPFGLPIYFPCTYDNGAHIGPSKFAVCSQAKVLDTVYRRASCHHAGCHDSIVAYQITNGHRLALTADTRHQWWAIDYFYCAMHYSAKVGIAIACRLSVTLVDQDHIG